MPESLLQLTYPDLAECLDDEQGELCASGYNTAYAFRIAPDDDASDGWQNGSAHDVLISLRYLNVGTDPIEILYSADGVSVTTGTIVTKTDTGKLKWKHLTAPLTILFGTDLQTDSDNKPYDFLIQCASEICIPSIKLVRTIDDAETQWIPSLMNALATHGEAVIDDTVTAAKFTTSIQSDNFSSGVSGWKIWRASGNAEFNDIVSRGTIYATAGEIANWDIGVINANTISADNGKVQLNSATPFISLGNLVNGYMDGKGFWVGKHSGDWKFHIGDPTAQYLNWDGTDLWDTGKKIGGSMAGWTVTSSQIYDSWTDTVGGGTVRVSTVTSANNLYAAASYGKGFNIGADYGVSNAFNVWVGQVPDRTYGAGGFTYSNRYGIAYRRYEGTTYFEVSQSYHASGAENSLFAQIAGWDFTSTQFSADNGKFVINSATPYMSLGNTVTGILSGKGIWAGKSSGVWQFRVGDPSDAYVLWNDTDFTIHNAGLEVFNGATQTGNIAKNGNGWFGSSSSNKTLQWWSTGTDAGDVRLGGTNDYFLWDDSAGQVKIYGESGKLVLDSNPPKIQLNTANVSSGTLSGAGFITKKDGSNYVLFVGDTSRYMFWNGTKLIKKAVKHKGTNELGDSDDGVNDNDLMVVYGHIQSDDWVTGATGSGWRISNSGNATFKNVNVRGSITASVFVKGMIEAKAGTLVIAKSAGKLNANMVVPSSGTWTMTIEDPPDTGWLFDNSDIIQVKETQGSVSTTWFTVTRGTQSGGNQTYTCTFANGTRPNTYAKGNVVVDFGTSGQGWLEMSADGSGAPYYSVRTHAGAPYTTVTERGRFGNLNGAFGIASNYYGLGVGNYISETSGNYLRYDTNGGFRLVAGDGAFLIDSAGVSIETLGWTGDLRAYKFTDSGTVMGGAFAGADASSRSLNFDLRKATGKTSDVSISSDAPSAKRSEIRLENYVNGSIVGKFALTSDGSGADRAYIADVDGFVVGSSGTTPQAMLQVVGGTILLDNNRALQAKDTGGTARDLIVRASDDAVSVLGYAGRNAMAGVNGATYMYSGDSSNTLALAAYPTSVRSNLTLETVGADGTARFALDTTPTSAQSIANNGTWQPFGAANNFSGIVIINDTWFGNVALVLVGNVITIGAQSSTNYSTTSGTASKINVYKDGSGFFTIENKAGSTITLTATAVRTRTTS